ncbi:CRISPR system CMR subunit Cmr6, partial [Bienertia sinuspersici]
MTQELHLQPSPATNTLQWRQHLRENENDNEANDAEELYMDEELQADANCPTHHPSAPPGELFDVETTIDPGYIISLIRKLLPADERRGDDVQVLGGYGNSTQRSDTDHMADIASSPTRNGDLNNLNGNIEMMETQAEQFSISTGTDDKDADPPKKSAREEVWEESGCVLWILLLIKNMRIL